MEMTIIEGTTSLRRLFMAAMAAKKFTAIMTAYTDDTGRFIEVTMPQRKLLDSDMPQPYSRQVPHFAGKYGFLISLLCGESFHCKIFTFQIPPARLCGR